VRPADDLSLPAASDLRTARAGGPGGPPALTNRRAGADRQSTPEVCRWWSHQAQGWAEGCGRACSTTQLCCSSEIEQSGRLGAASGPCGAGTCFTWAWLCRCLLSPLDADRAARPAALKRGTPRWPCEPFPAVLPEGLASPGCAIWCMGRSRRIGRTEASPLFPSPQVPGPQLA